MGLDVALGVTIALGALRGWFRGFTTQAVRLTGLVTCFYLALPVREQVRPYILARMPVMDPGLLDRILWWSSAVVSYIVLVGLITLAIQLTKSPPVPGAVATRRGDRIGGLLLGAAKSGLIVAFLAAGVEKYAEVARKISWADRQLDGSYALAWTTKYRPVPRLWATAPVRHFVEQIQQNGLPRSPEANGEKQLAELAPDESESSPRPPRLDLPPAEGLSPEAWQNGSELSEEVVRDLEKIKQELDAGPSNP
jgi:uncharacterized membrane protein required for colicin V production